jgi:hypothetical protein
MDILSRASLPANGADAHIRGPASLEITVQHSGEFAVSKAMGHPILVQAAKDSVQKSKLKCEGCGDKEHTFPIVYQFKIDDPPQLFPPVAEPPPIRRQKDRCIRCMYYGNVDRFGTTNEGVVLRTPQTPAPLQAHSQ